MLFAKLFQSRIVFGKKDLENDSLCIVGTRKELFLRSRYLFVLCDVKVHKCFRYCSLVDSGEEMSLCHSRVYQSLSFQP